MALRLETAAGCHMIRGAALSLVLVVASLSADVAVDVRHDHLKGGGTGRLIATEGELAFEESVGKKEHSWRLKLQDIQQLWIGMREIRVTTYADSRWRLGADREYALQAVAGATFEPLYAALKHRLDQRLVAAIAGEVQDTLWEVPAKLKRGFGGSEGVLEIGTDAIVYRSPEKNESRTWRVSDIENVSTAGPFDLTITTYEQGKSYTFQLKQPLDEQRYQSLWRRLTESRQLRILR